MSPGADGDVLGLRSRTLSQILDLYGTRGETPEKHELDFLFGKLQCSTQAEVRRFF
jgi:hypothetical protein